ncbi:MAG TPA: hypothetical protein VNC78_07635 [Actinomycetota bacterium]|nr:hypothetical protein [Actinomycetota bacterium]
MNAARRFRALLLWCVTTAVLLPAAAPPATSAPRDRLIVFARQESHDDPSREHGRSLSMPSLKKPAPNLDTDLFAVGSDGTGLRQLTVRANAEDDFPEWSPDGRRIVFTRRLGRRAPEIYVMDAGGDRAIRITHDRRWDYQPAWSPDGRRIAYTSWDPRRPGARLFIVAASPSAKARPLTTGCGDTSPAWSPDGRYIAFSRSMLEGCSSGNEEIFVVELQTGTVERLTYNSTNDWNPAWSPDGRWIVFEGYDCLIDSPPSAEGCIVGEEMELFVVRADGSETRQLTDNDVDEYWPAWSPDGREIVFARRQRSPETDLDLYVMNVDGGETKRVTGPSRSDDRNPDW